MAEQRAVYRLLNPRNVSELADQLNMILDRLSERLDQIEGYRGTPTFKASIDMGSNKITGLAVGTAAGEALTADLPDNSGLEVATSGLKVKTVTDGGLLLNASGVYVNPTAWHHGSMTGLSDDDHPQYLLVADIPGVDHGSFSGLGDDDHTLYLHKDGTESLQISEDNDELIHGFIRAEF